MEFVSNWEILQPRGPGPDTEDLAAWISAGQRVRIRASARQQQNRSVWVTECDVETSLYKSIIEDDDEWCISSVWDAAILAQSQCSPNISPHCSLISPEHFVEEVEGIKCHCNSTKQISFSFRLWVSGHTSTLKMQPEGSSEMLITAYQFTRCFHVANWI
jgi:hypothetical protein